MTRVGRMSAGAAARERFVVAHAKSSANPMATECDRCNMFLLLLDLLLAASSAAEVQAE